MRQALVGAVLVITGIAAFIEAHRHAPLGALEPGRPGEPSHLSPVQAHPQRRSLTLASCCSLIFDRGVLFDQLPAV
jgi:hypothetical protein